MYNSIPYLVLSTPSLRRAVPFISLSGQQPFNEVVEEQPNCDARHSRLVLPDSPEHPKPLLCTPLRLNILPAPLLHPGSFD